MTGTCPSDHAYRYWLTRNLRDLCAGDTRLTFIMLNPSTADESTDDPTIRRCIGFAKREGCAEMVVANLFAKRSTDPRGLHSEPAKGPNDREIDAWRRAFHERDGMIVAAWGSGAGFGWLRQGIEERAEHLRAIADGRPLYCLGRTKAGFPRHPLYLPAATPIEIFD
jgi:hypothetical protein